MSGASMLAPLVFFVSQTLSAYGAAYTQNPSAGNDYGGFWGASAGDTCAEETTGTWVPFDKKSACCVLLTSDYPAGPDGQCPADGVISTLYDATIPTGCIFDNVVHRGMMFFNEHPNGAGNSDWIPLCMPGSEATYTFLDESERNPSVSGDPIAEVNGFRVKFDMPLSEDTLLVAGHGVQVFGRADLMTPDKNSQWFSEIKVFKDALLIAHIERKALEASVVKPDLLNSLFLTIMGEGGKHNVSRLGSYQSSDGTANIHVRRDGVQLGHVPREVVTVEASGMKFSVACQIAVKFKNLHQALKYAHLDIEFHNLKSADKGIFAEMYGFIPMSPKTAGLIRSMTASS